MAKSQLIGPKLGRLPHSGEIVKNVRQRTDSAASPAYISRTQQAGWLRSSYPSRLTLRMYAGLSLLILEFQSGNLKSRWSNDRRRLPLPTSTAMRTINSPRVLYIEDHEDTRELVTIVLEQRSYEVVTGATIKSGVALAGSQHFDLYLLDSWLPDGSGLDLCRQIREFDKVTPILFYSAAAYEIDRDQAIKSGAQAYLIKPSHPAELCNMVTALIDSHRQVLCAAS